MLKRKFGIIFTAIIVFCGTLSAASNQDSGHWGNYGIKTKLNDKTSFSSSAEFRFRDNITDLHYIKWETGLAYKLSKRVGLGGFYRFNPSEKSGQWNNAHYMLLDQNIKLFTIANWGVDYRSRFHIRMGELGRGFWRSRVQLAYKFNFKGHGSSWFINNEAWYQISDINGRDRYNVNWLTSGFKLPLAKNIQFSPYYRLRSDKVTSTGKWTHLHVMGTSVNYVF